MKAAVDTTEQVPYSAALLAWEQHRMSTLLTPRTGRHRPAASKTQTWSLGYQVGLGRPIPGAHGGQVLVHASPQDLSLEVQEAAHLNAATEADLHRGAPWIFNSQEEICAVQQRQAPSAADRPGVGSQAAANMGGPSCWRAVQPHIWQPSLWASPTGAGACIVKLHKPPGQYSTSTSHPTLSTGSPRHRPG